jgi:hypothetical protein
VSVGVSTWRRRLYDEIMITNFGNHGWDTQRSIQYTIHVIENIAVLEFDTRMFRPCKPLPTIAIGLSQLFDFSDIIVEWLLPGALVCFARDLMYNIEEIGCNVVAKTLC